MSGFDDQPLKDWLNKKNSDHEDAFDKEAREGFDMLASDEEALSLKSTLNKKIHGQLFEDKNSRRPFYWMAAAAMLIISGLSAYFIINDTTNSQNMAIARMPEPENQNPAMEKSFDEKAAEITAEASEEPIVAAPKKNKTALPSTAQSQPVAEADYASAAYKTDKDMASTRDDESADEHLSKQESAKPVVNSVKKTNEAEERAEENKASDVAAFKNDVKKEKSVRAKLAEPMAASPVHSETKALIANNCYYKGGHEALKRELEKKLKTKNLNRNFDAVLYVSANKHVIKVDLVNKIDFSEEEQAELLTILKSLNDFRFETTPEPSVVSEYTLRYLAK